MLKKPALGRFFLCLLGGEIYRCEDKETAVALQNKQAPIR
jgi:hypothetical protein